MLQGKKITVLMGGPGSEREVSLASGKAIVKALRDTGFDVNGVDINDAHFELSTDTDLAINAIHGTFGEDGQLQDILEAKGIPYTGAGSASSKLAIDKSLSKERFLAAGVPTAHSETVALNADSLPELTIKAPLVIKPPLEGSSVGIQIVKEQDQVSAALMKAAEKYSEVLIEEFIQGKELTVGILNGKPLPIVHIIPPDGDYDFSSKYPWLSGGKGSQYICPADLDPVTTKSVQDAAVAAYDALGIEVYARVDVLLDEKNQPFVLEANTIPGMTETSLLPKAAAAAGIPFPTLCQIIAELSLNINR